MAVQMILRSEGLPDRILDFEAIANCRDGVISGMACRLIGQDFPLEAGRGFTLSWDFGSTVPIRVIADGTITGVITPR